MLLKEFKPLKEFKVTIWPRPRTYMVMAENEWQAAGVADQNYVGEHAILENVSYRHDVEEVLPESNHEVSSLPEQSLGV